jgi:hypothetical protein
MLEADDDLQSLRQHRPQRRVMQALQVRGLNDHPGLMIDWPGAAYAHCSDLRAGGQQGRKVANTLRDAAHNDLRTFSRICRYPAATDNLILGAYQANLDFRPAQIDTYHPFVHR